MPDHSELLAQLADRSRTREREDRAIAELEALIAQNGGHWPSFARAGIGSADCDRFLRAIEAKHRED